MDFQVSNESDSEDAEQMADINIVPLVDVMLVLLIIFMVTAPLSIGGISVSLPQSKARSSLLDEQRVVLSINRKGDYYIEKMEVKGPALESRLKAIYAVRDNKDLYIRADKKVIYEKVVAAMSAAKIAGVGRISMLTEPPKR